MPTDLQNQSETERRQLAAFSVLLWIKDNITEAPEQFVRELGEHISVSYCRNALELIGCKGEKLSASVLKSLDDLRLDSLHNAAMQHQMKQNVGSDVR